jgi:phosphatidylserine/phosphatidylglycerophosphate/cardiolipin synthase-like enzyme
MRFGSSAAIGDEGVAFVAHKVLRELKWIFRDTPKADVGIDAIVEYVRDAEAQSRMISLQIKSGRSYLKERTDEGIVFRSDARHLRYFLNHSLPVLVVLYDPEEQQALWERVSRRTVQITGEGWSMIIPFANRLGRDSAPRWAKIAGKGDLQSDVALSALKPRVASFDGSLITTHEMLMSVEESLLVAAPFASVELLALLEFLATRVRVRLLTSELTLDQPWMRKGMHPSRLEIRVGRGLHGKFMIADESYLFVTSANLSHANRGLREVMIFSGDRLEAQDAVLRFEAAWEDAIDAAMLARDLPG